MGATASMFYSGAVEAAAGTIVSGAVSSVTSTFQMQDGIEVTLYSLQQELMKIQCAINAARERRITDQMLLEWLGQIINASYLGNYIYRTFKHQNTLPLMIESEGMDNLDIYLDYPSAKRQRTITTLLFGDEEQVKLHDVLKMLKSIDIYAFLLMVNAQPERPMKTYLYMDRNGLFKMDIERQQVMNFLFEPNKTGDSNVSLLPIVGSAGGGKTSLAVHCFYDTKVKIHFSLKIYIGSTHNMLKKIQGFPVVLNEIIEQCHSTCTTNYDVNTLLAMLKQNLRSERFLLVLDHVWDVDCTLWNALWDCLTCGKQGSKVIFIPHLSLYNEYNKIVSTGEVKPIELDGFCDDEYMVFFKEHAFGSADPEDYPELEKIGMKIVKKMNGSIWGAKILGELLRDNLNVPFWSNFLQAGLLSPQASGKDIWPVIKTMSLLLSKSLKVIGLVRGTGPVEHHPSHEVKTFRELMVLGHNYCTPVIKEGKYCVVELLVSEHVFPNRCEIFTAICQPLRNKSLGVIKRRRGLSL
ncbi:Disease resistance protein RGA2 [Rhynchospora pubera]|uniref:Disease resistance protein RGA2 n=1 Tax=Rhynchospora pubera TaxID=906938 RepID=A0AAV8F6N5_9POAL|nr:Disease resistance protein RGA2 [Rhynchospora pubera]